MSLARSSGHNIPLPPQLCTRCKYRGGGLAPVTSKSMSVVCQLPSALLLQSLKLFTLYEQRAAYPILNQLTPPSRAIIHVVTHSSEIKHIRWSTTYYYLVVHGSPVLGGGEHEPRIHFKLRSIFLFFFFFFVYLINNHKS